MNTIRKTMQIENHIRSEKSKLLELCQQLGVAGLRVRVDTDDWQDVTFIGDIDTSRLDGYADRFFGLEEGLTSIFHRRVRLLDEEMEKKQKKRYRPMDTLSLNEIELLHAS